LETQTKTDSTPEASIDWNATMRKVKLSRWWRTRSAQRAFRREARKREERIKALKKRLKKAT